MLITLFFFNDTATTEIYTLSLHDAVPLRDGCVDLVFSEYGASIWCDPHHWVAEAARVLRPGGRLVFLVNAWLAVLCQDEVGNVSDRLRREWRAAPRGAWGARAAARA